jgi:hypothetical protein
VNEIAFKVGEKCESEQTKATGRCNKYKFIYNNIHLKRNFNPESF